MRRLRWIILVALVLGACVREVVLVVPPPDGGPIGDAFSPDDGPGDGGVGDVGGAD
jgi:hypothetical protein